jgi:hypothetical protein
MVDDKREQELEPEDSNRLTGRNLKESGGLVGKRDKDDEDFDHLSGEGVDEAPKQSWSKQSWSNRDAGELVLALDVRPRGAARSQSRAQSTGPRQVDSPSAIAGVSSLDDHEALISESRDPHAGGVSSYAEPRGKKLGRHEPESTDPLQDC